MKELDQLNSRLADGELVGITHLNLNLGDQAGWFLDGNLFELDKLQSLQQLTVLNVDYTLGVGTPRKKSLDSLRVCYCMLKNLILILNGTRRLKPLVVGK